MSSENRIWGVAAILLGLGSGAFMVYHCVQVLEAEDVAQGRLATTMTTSVQCTDSVSRMQVGNTARTRNEVRAQYPYTFQVDGVEYRGHTTLEEECLAVDGPMEVRYEPRAPKTSELVAASEARIRHAKKTAGFGIGIALLLSLVGIGMYRSKPDSAESRPTA